MYAGVEDPPPIVIHYDNDTIYAGLTENEKPSIVFSAVVDRNNPVWDHGPRNTDDMEKILFRAIHKELVLEPEQHPVLISGAWISSEQSRNRMAEIIFEIFNVRTMYMGMDAHLSFSQSTPPMTSESSQPAALKMAISTNGKGTRKA